MAFVTATHINAFRREFEEAKAEAVRAQARADEAGLRLDAQLASQGLPLEYQVPKAKKAKKATVASKKAKKATVASKKGKK